MRRGFYRKGREEMAGNRGGRTGHARAPVAGTKWREEKGGRKMAGTNDCETNLLEKTKICAVRGNMSGKIMATLAVAGNMNIWADSWEKQKKM